VSLRGLHNHAAAGVGGLALGVAVVWVAFKALGNGLSASGDFPQFVVVTLNGLTVAGLYFIIASGFTLIFGLMRIVNMAHGSLYLLGGYIAFELQEEFSGAQGASTSGFGGGNVMYADWLLPLVISCLTVGFVGLAMHQLFLRWNQGQELRQALITIAISIIAADQMLAHFGGIAEDIKLPASLDTSLSLHIYGLTYGRFRLLVLLVAIVVGVLLVLMFKKTRFGMIVRAGVDDRAMVSALGVNIQLVFAGAFFLGAALAGLGGVFGGTMVALGPGEDSAFLLNSLIVVIIGGMGSLGGAAIGALALGLVQSYAQLYLVIGGADYTFYSILLTFALLVLVLAIRPLGLFGRPA
jgi:branched-chain amino acid transport system permease protein